MAIVNIPKTEADFNDVQTAYFAGLFDGEGCARMTSRREKGTVYYYPTLKIAMTDEETVTAIAQYFGCGSTGTRPGPLAHHKQQWWWQVSTKQARDVAQRLLPFAITKRKAFQEILNFPVDTRFGKRLQAEDARAIRLACFQDKLMHVEIAEKFGITSGTVWGILTRKTWKDSDLDLPTIKAPKIGRPKGTKNRWKLPTRPRRDDRTFLPVTKR